MTLETLLAERAIHRQLVRFARAMDARDWQALNHITTNEVSADLGAGKLQGRRALIDNMRSFLDDCGPTQHLLGNVLIDVDGDTAHSQTYVSDVHLGAEAQSKRTFSTLGDYHDKWVQINGEWRMNHRTKHNRAHIGDIKVLGAGPDTNT